MVLVDTDYATQAPNRPDPFDVDRANRGAEIAGWLAATDNGADTAFARARRARDEADWTAPAVTS